jgi:hypothetical protein
MDTTITGLNGNNARDANFTINILDAEIIPRQDYLGTLIRNEAWIGATSTLLVTATTSEKDGTLIAATSSTYTCLVDQPLRDFMNAAMVQYQAEIDDVRMSYAISGANVYSVTAQAKRVNGSDNTDVIRAWNVEMTAATLTFVDIT